MVPQLSYSCPKKCVFPPQVKPYRPKVLFPILPRALKQAEEAQKQAEELLKTVEEQQLGGDRSELGDDDLNIFEQVHPLVAMKLGSNILGSSTSSMDSGLMQRANYYAA